MVEQPAVNRRVTGSSPVSGAIFKMFWVYILQNPLGQFYIGRTALATGRFPFHGIIFTYDNVKGIVQVAQDGTKYVQLATGKNKPSDAVLDDFRLLRTTVNKAALNGRLSAYYMDSTWETRLPAFCTAGAAALILLGFGIAKPPVSALAASTCFE